MLAAADSDPSAIVWRGRYRLPERKIVAGADLADQEVEEEEPEVDGDEHQVEVWTPGDTLPTVERHQLHWHPDGAGSAFTLELAELFRPL